MIIVESPCYLNPSNPDVSKSEFSVSTNSLYSLALKDPYGGLQTPNFLELQQKNVAAGENSPYGGRHAA